jgi:hypothetical protein
MRRAARKTDYCKKVLQCLFTVKEINRGDFDFGGLRRFVGQACPENTRF